VKKCLFTLGLILFTVFVSEAVVLADEPVGVKLEKECWDARASYEKGKMREFPKEVKKEFIGCTGVRKKYWCVSDATIVLTFKVNGLVEGDVYQIVNQFWKKGASVKGRAYENGSLLLKETRDKTSPFYKYEFRGTYKDGVISGLWQKGAEDQFLFWVEHKESK